MSTPKPITVNCRHYGLGGRCAHPCSMRMFLPNRLCILISDERARDCRHRRPDAATPFVHPLPPPRRP